MRALAVVLLGLAAAACGPGSGDAPNTQEIARLSTPENLAAPPPEPIVALASADVAAGGGSPLCLFRRGGTALLVWFGDAGVARVNGAARRFSAAASVGPEGGFFESGQITISVGRDDEGGLLMLTDRGAGRQEDYRGEWLCRTAR